MPSRKQNRSERNRRSMYGGMSPVNDSSMALSGRNSLAQGQDFESIHKYQHGGSAPYPGSVGVTLPSAMVMSARTGPLDTAIGQIQGMQDGGRRRRKSRASRKSRNTRKHRGGYHRFMGSPLSADSMLLPPGSERQAALSHEWGLAKDPNSFSPKA